MKENCEGAIGGKYRYDNAGQFLLSPSIKARVSKVRKSKPSITVVDRHELKGDYSNQALAFSG